MNVLFIVPDRIGVAVMASGALDYFIQRYGSKGLNLWLVTGQHAADLFRDAPIRIYERNIRSYPQRSTSNALTYLLKKIPVSLHKKWILIRLAWHVRKIKWDLVIDLSFTSSLFVRLLRTKKLSNITKARKFPGILADLQTSDGRRRNFRISGLGRVRAPRLWICPSRREEALCILPKDGKVLAICPTASQSHKEWPVAFFAKLVDMLTRPGGLLAGYHVFLTGTHADRERCSLIVKRVRHGCLIDGFGMPIALAASIIGRSRLFLGNDSGFTHIAAALGILTLGIFGPTDEEHYAPMGTRARIVRYDKDYDTAMIRLRKKGARKDSNILVKNLEPGFVLQVIKDMLREDRALLPLKRAPRPPGIASRTASDGGTVHPPSLPRGELRSGDAQA